MGKIQTRRGSFLNDSASVDACGEMLAQRHALCHAEARRRHPMLKHLKVHGFKSLADVEVSFPRLTVLFGPNAAGKSNLLEAVQLISRIATSRTLSDAFASPVRGYP